MFKKAASRNVDAARVRTMEATLAAIDRAQAVIEFDLDGTVLRANENFLKTLGYQAEAVIGRHHSMFVDPDYARSPDYERFWSDLRSGTFASGKFRRLAQGGREVWIRATYNPIFDETGKPYRVIKFATDITASEQTALQNEALRKAAEEAQVAVVTSLGAALASLAQNDLARPIHETFPGDYQRIRNDFNAALEQLRQAMQEIAATGSSMLSSMNQISEATDDLSRRTEQQAAGLEQTAASLNEITTTVRRTSDATKSAQAAVDGARKEAETSAGVVKTAIDAMTAIETSSGEIAKIIGVIDEIAFQTNLLALNAGVEAARAGDAGRGFAVVASEVRALAQRSAEAAREIKALIHASATQVSTGVDLVGRTGEALTRIVGKVSEISGIVVEIARAASEQSVALVEVNTAVTQMDQVTQQNAAMVSETSEASRSMASEAHRLTTLIERFNLTQGDDRGAARDVAARSRDRDGDRRRPSAIQAERRRLAS